MNRQMQKSIWTLNAALKSCVIEGNYSYDLNPLYHVTGSM